MLVWSTVGSRLSSALPGPACQTSYSHSFSKQSMPTNPKRDRTPTVALHCVLRPLCSYNKAAICWQQNQVRTMQGLSSDKTPCCVKIWFCCPARQVGRSIGWAGTAGKIKARGELMAPACRHAPSGGSNLNDAPAALLAPRHRSINANNVVKCALYRRDTAHFLLCPPAPDVHACLDN